MADIVFDSAFDELAARDIAGLLPRSDWVRVLHLLLGREGQEASLDFGVFQRFLLEWGRDHTAADDANLQPSCQTANQTSMGPRPYGRGKKAHYA